MVIVSAMIPGFWNGTWVKGSESWKMDGQTDGRMKGWIGGWMDVWNSKQVIIYKARLEDGSRTQAEQGIILVQKLLSQHFFTFTHSTSGR